MILLNIFYPMSINVTPLHLLGSPKSLLLGTGTRLFKIIKKHGVKYQFGSTPGVGCQDGSFTIKTMLHLRYNHNLPTFVMFADLVKAFDTSNHKPMVEILKKYGCPPKLCSTIRRMYTDNNVRLILGKIDISIPFEVGVK